MPDIETATPYLDIRWNHSRRSPGVHISQVIRTVAIAMGVFEDDDDDFASLEDRIRLQSPAEAAADSKLVRISCGLAWEEWYGRMLETASIYPGFVYHPGEYSAPACPAPHRWLGRDNPASSSSSANLSFPMFGNPDGISESPSGSLAVHEIKYTYKSDRHEPRHYWHHICQISIYCHLLSIATGLPVLDAYLHMIHVRGNYRDTFPTLRVYRLSFTTAEIAANWSMLSTEAKILLDSGSLVPESGTGESGSASASASASTSTASVIPIR